MDIDKIKEDIAFMFGEAPEDTVKFQKRMEFTDYAVKVYKAGMEEGAREYRRFILNVLDGVDIADGECNTKAIRYAIQSRIIDHTVTLNEEVV